MLKQPLSRILEIDALRGVAIILMVIFHIIVDLTDFYGYHFQYLSGFWYYEGKAAAILFMLLAGVSSSFSRSAVRHGLELLAWGMVLTAVTWLFAPAMYIRFGILHFLGTSLLTWPLLKKLQPRALLLVAAGAVAPGGYVAELTGSTIWLLPFGVMPANFASMDYYPLFPWYGVFVMGAAAGKTLYAQQTSLFPALTPPRWLVWLGRRSLAIYLLHQPLILGMLYLVL